MRQKSNSSQPLLKCISNVLASDGNPVKQTSRSLKKSHDHEVIAKAVGISLQDVHLFCLLLTGQVNAAEPQGIAELASHLACSKMEAIQVIPNLINLEKKGIIESAEKRKGLPNAKKRMDRKYWVTHNITEKVLGLETEPVEMMEDEFFLMNYLGELGVQLSNYQMSDDVFYETVEHVLSENSHFELIRAIRDLNLSLLEQTILLITIRCTLNDEELGLNQLMGMLTKSVRNRVMVKSALVDGEYRLMADRYVALRLDVMGMSHVVCLGVKGNSLLKHLGSISANNALYHEEYSTLIQTIEPKAIKPLELVYDEDIAIEYRRLQKLLSKEGIEGIFDQLEKKGLRKGVTVLLSGPSGTGKTEMVKQLAMINSNRLLMVNMSDMKDVFVGSSEKNVRKLFQMYDQEWKVGDGIPILLLNEADALIGKRQLNTDRNHAVTKMLNTIQTVLLQKIEDLEGILIATTNLPEAFDEAFARRFLINVHVGRPSLAARKAIWEKYYPMLSKAELQQLAEHPLTGADIENVAIRMTHLEILENAQPNCHSLLGLIRTHHTTTITPVLGFKISA